jgi:hypothetical protein
MKKDNSQSPKPLNEGSVKNSFGKEKPSVQIVQTAPPPAPKPKPKESNK